MTYDLILYYNHINWIFSLLHSSNTYKFNFSNIHWVVCVCTYLYLLSFSLELLDVLSSLFPSNMPPGSNSLVVLLYIPFMCVSCSLPNHITSLFFFFLFNNENYIFRREKKKEAKIEKRRKKKNWWRMLVKKERSGENSLVQCSITISCALPIIIRERLMSDYSI